VGGIKKKKRAYGVVYDSNVAYNIDVNFRALALEFTSDVTKVPNSLFHIN